MDLSTYIEKINIETEGSAWEVHYQALQAKRDGDDVIVLSIGDHGFHTPSAIVSSAVAALEGGRHHYTDALGDIELRQAIAQHVRSSGRNETSFENIAIVPGAQNGLFASVLSIFNPGDEVICFDPMYVTYESVFLARDVVIKKSNLRAENNFRPDIEDIKSKISSNTKAIMLNTPNNPLGVVFSAEEMQQIAQLCKDNNLWLISDEVYGEFIYNGVHSSAWNIPGIENQVIVLGSLSKSHAMTGWRIGWIQAPSYLIAKMEALLGAMLFGVANFIQVAARYAIENGANEVAQIRDIYQTRLELVTKKLAEIDELKVFMPSAGMFVMVDVSRVSSNGSAFASSLLNQQKVSVLPGSGFGETLNNFVRISLTASDEDLKKACHRIALFCEQAVKE